MQPKRITRARPPVDPPLTGWVIGIWGFVDQAAVGAIGKLAIGRWKYLRVLSTIEGRMEWKIDKMIGMASSVIRMLKGELSIQQMNYIPTLTCGSGE